MLHGFHGILARQARSLKERQEDEVVQFQELRSSPSCAALDNWAFNDHDIIAFGKYIIQSLYCRLHWIAREKSRYYEKRVLGNGSGSGEPDKDRRWEFGGYSWDFQHQQSKGVRATERVEQIRCKRGIPGRREMS